MYKKKQCVNPLNNSNKISRRIGTMTIKKMILLSILAGCLGATWITAGKMNELQQSQIHIAKQVIRFHVRANSDTAQDQEEKMLVKKQVVAYLQPLMANVHTIEEGRGILESHQEEIEKKAEQVLGQTSGRKAKVYLTREKFPVKTYGDFTFPPGEYEALRIDIGEGQGRNWWCVMYPSLCFVDEVHGIVPEESKQKLRYVLTETDYKNLKPEYHLKVVDAIKSSKWIQGLLE